MIEVIIRHVGSETELGKITIENVGGDEELADYSVRFGVERVKFVGVHQRGIYAFPRKRYNVFGLLLQALNTLEERDLELDGEVDSSDMARRFRRARLKIQRGENRRNRN